MHTIKARNQTDYQVTYDRKTLIRLFNYSDNDDYVLDKDLDYISK